ncbi:hypothetical protein [Alkalicoccobacillus gibsonii]|nr:hypothetical protein [Alkalicoccobacillus gibsonii]MBM0065453.1 hypothetical protein [Alkalicoccobacillus gibsonii]
MVNESNYWEESDTGTILTLEYGIRYSKMYLEWCEWAKAYLKQFYKENDK